MLHSWEVLAKILGSEEVEGVVCDIGMYVRSRLLVRRGSSVDRFTGR